MDIALAPRETRYIQIDSESDLPQFSPADGYNVYDVSVTAAPFVNFEVYAYTPQKGYNSEFNFSGSEEAISASFVCDFYSPVVVAITNDSDSETVVNTVIKKSEEIVSAATSLLEGNSPLTLLIASRKIIWNLASSG